MFNSILHLNQMKSQVTRDPNQSTNSNGVNLIYLKYWELAIGYLKLSVMNELVQTYRTTSKVLHPLLNILFILSKSFEPESATVSADKSQDDIGRDLTCTLLKVIQKTTIDPISAAEELKGNGGLSHSEMVIKACILNLVML